MHLLVALGLLTAPAELQDLPVLHSPEEILAVVRRSERPTVVHFWATWCEACVRELPALRQLEVGLADLGATTLLISLDDPGSPASVLRFLSAHGLLIPSAQSALLDAPDPTPVTQRFDPHWGAQLPATFVVLQSGAVTASHLGRTPTGRILREVRDQIVPKNAGVPPPARRLQ
jgi:peroxiredoxin